MALAFAFGPFTGVKKVRQSVTNVLLSVVTLNDVQNKSVIPELNELKLANFPALNTFINNYKIETAVKPLKKITKVSPNNKNGYASKDIVKLINQLEGSRKTKKDTVKQKKILHPKNYSLKIDGKKWRLLKNDLNLKSDVAFIKIGDVILKSNPQENNELTLVKIKWFAQLRYMLFGFFLLAAFLSLKGLYKKLPGINLNPIWASKLGDFISILFLSTLGYTAIEYLLHAFTGAYPYFYDSLFVAMGAIFYIPVMLIFTFFNSKQFSQNIEITKEGITVYYLEKSSFVEWKQIQKFELLSSFLLVSRLNFPMPKKLQTYLVIKTEKNSIYIVEPDLKSIKNKILRALKNNCQENLKPQIATIIDKW
ncbi:hypothetical protein Lupro_09670 [Lutibacter profundi]|uniref:Uncharacterized protein n=1 Tax=Lutibacter profundi TaxID=1622118 RepID=A0A0X8G7I7_9FLAO|nr:hypothetical protein Lupro_09670 [Lutibacter profundi]